MRLRRVAHVDGRSTLALHVPQGWVPLVPALERHAGPDVDPRWEHDVVALLGAPPEARSAVVAAADATAREGEVLDDPPALVPLEPWSVRLAVVWEEHAAAVGEVTARRFPIARLGGAGVLQVGRRRRRDREALHARRGDPRAVVGDGAEVRWPWTSSALDIDAGLAAVVVAPVRDATPAEARAAIGGAVAALDVVARDVEAVGGLGGAFGSDAARDLAIVLGRDVVGLDDLADALGARGDLAASLVVDGDERAHGVAPSAIERLVRLVADASRGSGLERGDVVVALGIPGCSGAAADRWLSPGERVVLDAGALGRVHAVVGAPEPRLRGGPLERVAWSSVPRAGDVDPPPIEVQRWDPPDPPALVGPWAPGDALDAVERWELPGGTGPEDVVIDGDGSVWTGVADGRIVRWRGGDRTAAEVVADTHGRPLGLELHPDGRLVVCDADRGLLALDPATGSLEVLADRVGGRCLRFTNNAAVAADGRVFFTDSSTRTTVHDYRRDLLEHSCTGRVLVHDPRDGTTDVVVDGLAFPNGVALGPDDTYLVVAETARYRVQRLDLTGADAGRPRPVVENLAGFPDNVAPSSRPGAFWVALPNRRNSGLDALLPRPALRRWLSNIPEPLQPQPARYGLVAEVTADGEVLRSLHGPRGAYAMIAGVREHDGWLHLGSLTETAIARVRVR